MQILTTELVPPLPETVVKELDEWKDIYRARRDLS